MPLYDNTSRPAALRRALTLTLAACVAGQLAASAAYAQTARTGGSANAQLMQQMQQLASERTALQAENEKIKKELEDVKKERDQLKKGHDAMDQRVRAGEAAQAALARATRQRESTDQELTQTKAKMQELIGKFRETLQQMRELETDDAANKQSLAVRNHEIQVCIDRNLALYKLNDEVLTHIEKQGAWSRVALAEPFTRIKRVQNENLVVEYKAKAADQRAKPASSSGAAASSGAASPPPSAASSPSPTSAAPPASPPPLASPPPSATSSPSPPSPAPASSPSPPAR